MEKDGTFSSIPYDSDNGHFQKESWPPVDHPQLSEQKQAIVLEEVEMNKVPSKEQPHALSPAEGLDDPEEAESQWGPIILPVYPMTRPSVALSFGTVEWNMPAPSSETPYPSSQTPYPTVDNGFAELAIHSEDIDTDFTSEDTQNDDGQLEAPQPLNSTVEEKGSVSQPCDMLNTEEETKPTTQEEEDPVWTLPECIDTDDGLAGDSPADHREEEDGQSVTEEAVEAAETLLITEEGNVDSEPGVERQNVVDSRLEEEQERPDILLTGQADLEQEPRSATVEESLKTEEQHLGRAEAENYTGEDETTVAKIPCHKENEVPVSVVLNGPCERDPLGDCSNHIGLIVTPDQAINLEDFQKLTEGWRSENIQMRENADLTDETVVEPLACEVVNQTSNSEQRAEVLQQPELWLLTEICREEPEQNNQAEQPYCLEPPEQTQHCEETTEHSAEPQDSDPTHLEDTEPSEQFQPSNWVELLNQTQSSKEYSSESTEPEPLEHTEQRERSEKEKQAEKSPQPEKKEQSEQLEKDEQPQHAEKDQQTEQPQQLEKEEPTEQSQQSGKEEHPEESEQPEKRELAEKEESTEKTQQPEKEDSTEKSQQPEKRELPEKSQQPEKEESTEKSQQPEKRELPEKSQPEKRELPKKLQQPEKRELPEKSQQPEKEESTEKSQQPEKEESTERSQQPEKEEPTEKSQQPEKEESTEKSQQPEKEESTEKSQQPEKREQPEKSQPEKEESTEKSQQPEKREQPEKSQQPEKREQPEKSQQPEKREQPEKSQPEKEESTEKSQQPEKEESTERSQQPEKEESTETSQQPEMRAQPEKSQQPEKREQPEKSQPEKEVSTEKSQQPEREGRPEQSKQSEYIALMQHTAVTGQPVQMEGSETSSPSPTPSTPPGLQAETSRTDETNQAENKSPDTEVTEHVVGTEFTQQGRQTENSPQNIQADCRKGAPMETGVSNGGPPGTLENETVVDREKACRLAERLYRLDGIQHKDVVRHLDKDNDFSRAVGEEYLKFFDFTGQTLDESLRSFLKVVLLIGETQERERVLQHFACRFHQCNPHSLPDAETVLTLTCALMLLNSDLHGQNVGKAMSTSDFVSNLDGMDEGQNFSKELLKNLYSSIKNEPLEWAVDEEELKSSMLLEDDAKEDAPVRCKSNPFQDVPHDSKATVFKQGFLQRKTHADIDGKRTPWGKRSWKTFYGVLRGMVLYLHKDEYKKEYHSTEEVVSVHHALAERAINYTKKPHVFRLQTADWRVFLFQASSRAEMSSWINRMNLVSALHSSPPFPAAVGSQRRFCRPILPASQSAHTLDRQLQSHAGMLESFQNDLTFLRQNLPEGRRAKAKELEEHRVREDYLQHEICRYEAYIRVLEAWKGLNMAADAVVGTKELTLFDKALCKDFMGDEDEEVGLKKSHSSPSLDLEMAPPPLVKVKRNISERRTYRKTIIPRRHKIL